VLGDGCNSTGQSFDLNEQSIPQEVAVENSGQQVRKETHLQTAEVERPVDAGFAWEMLQIRVDHWQTQDALDAVEQAR
jgi:hypothetical protein